ISGRRAAWLGGATALLAFFLFGLMIYLGVNQFFSLLGRTFVPFVERTIPTRTQLTLLRPEGGDLTVPTDYSVQFAVQVDGRVPEPGRPDAVRLLFRYQNDGAWEELPFEKESGREWVATLPAYQVQNGFFYKVAGGDDETAEYRVRVRST